jgi:hypothetical protein
VASLRNLEHLHIRGSDSTMEDCAPLTKLCGNLRSLHLEACFDLPTCLSSLTVLTALRLRTAEPLSEADKASVEAVLCSIPVLAQLQLDIPYLPRQLTSLRSVTALYCQRQESSVALPAGRWLASLRRFGADLELVRDSLSSLSAAENLEVLALQARGVPISAGSIQYILLSASDGSCSLSQLAVDESMQADVHIDLREAAAKLQRRRPTLRVDFLPDACKEVCSPEFYAHVFEA